MSEEAPATQAVPPGERNTGVDSAHSRPEPVPITEIATALAPIAAGFHDLVDQQKGLVDLLNEKVLLDTGRESQIERLHSELQQHKDDLLGRVQLPVLRDIITLNHGYTRVLDDWEALPLESRDSEKFLKNLRTFCTEALDILARHGITTVTEEGDRFNTRTQKSVKAIPTSDPSKDKTVASRYRPGYMYRDRVLLPEEVVVFRLTPQATAPHPNNSPQASSVVPNLPE